MDIVNEGTAFTIDVTFPATPTSVSYHIYDVEIGTNVLTETSVTPAAALSISITSNDTAITDSTKEINRRIVVVSSEYNNDPLQTKVDTYQFWVRNIASV